MKEQCVYLRDILERIRRIEAVATSGRETFMSSFLHQDATLRSFEVIGEVVKRLSPALTEAHPTMPWRQNTGFCDVLIHDYERIDLEAVWRVIEDDLAALKQAITTMLETLDDKATATDD